MEYGKQKGKQKQNQTIDYIGDNKAKSETIVAVKYKDYLTETRKEKEKNHLSSEIYHTPLAEVERIMKNHQLERKERVAKAKELADRFDHSNMDVVKKVAGKLQILQIMN